MYYLALKMDIVASRRVPHRQHLQERLFQATTAVNGKYRAELASLLTVTHGDEVQGMLPASQARMSLPICEELIDLLRPYDVRFGLGFGTLATEVQEHAIGMDGETWHRAQAALERAKKERKTFVIRGLPGDADTQITAIVDLLLSLRLRWSEQQREAARWLLELGTQKAAAERLNISPAAVSKRLSGCLWTQYEALRSVAMECVDQIVGEQAHR